MAKPFRLSPLAFRLRHFRQDQLRPCPGAGQILAAVGDDQRAGDVGRQRRGQEHAELPDVVRRAEAAQRELSI